MGSAGLRVTGNVLWSETLSQGGHGGLTSIVLWAVFDFFQNPWFSMVSDLSYFLETFYCWVIHWLHGCVTTGIHWASLFLSFLWSPLKTSRLSGTIPRITFDIPSPAIHDPWTQGIWLPIQESKNKTLLFFLPEWVRTIFSSVFATFRYLRDLTYFRIFGHAIWKIWPWFDLVQVYYWEVCISGLDSEHA